MRFLTGMVPLLLALGCAQHTVLDERDVESLREIDPFPLRATVSVEVQGDAWENGKEDSRIWTDQLVRGLREINAFSDVRALHDAGEDPVDGDIRLEIRMTPTPGDYISDAETTTSLAVLNGFLWFAAGVPAWFIADKEYPSLFEVKVYVTRPGLKGGRFEAMEFTTRNPSICFWDRSSTSQFLIQILVPPPLVEEDSEELMESLELESLGEVYLKAAQYAKSELPLQHAREGQAFLFQPPGDGGVVVLARQNISRLLVNGHVPVGAEETGMLKFIEDHRITDSLERDRRLGLIEKYFGDLAKGTPEVTEEPVTTEELGDVFRRWYWFELEDLAADDEPRPLRLEVEVEQHGEPIRWTLRNGTPDVGDPPSLALAGNGLEMESVKE